MPLHHPTENPSPAFDRDMIWFAMRTSSATPVSLELGGKYGMLFLSPAGKNKRNNQTMARGGSDRRPARHTNLARQLAPRDVRLLCQQPGGSVARLEAGIGRDMNYFFAIGLKAPYEAYPGQPAREITPRSDADRRDWIIGTPQDAIAQIERMLGETGGFGGLLLTTHEWAPTDKLRRSYELFARYVMPHFRGHTQGYHDQGRRIQQSGETTATLSVSRKVVHPRRWVPEARRWIISIAENPIHEP